MHRETFRYETCTKGMLFLSHPCLNEVILCLLQSKQEESHRTELCGGVIGLQGVTVSCLVSSNFPTQSRAMLGTLLRKEDCMTEKNVFCVGGVRLHSA